MKFYKHVLIPLGIGLLSFVCFIIYSKVSGDTNLQLSNALFISVGIFIGAIPVSFFIEHQKNKGNGNFNS
ncbi:hypothetical protein [Priestia megaterium]|uniref:hypothetical protein n=1 Tax=Priestia TaxID=2800373 RepID=UPI0012B9630C|nr:hypothetical protein [Priestia megaterium]